MRHPAQLFVFAAKINGTFQPLQRFKRYHAQLRPIAYLTVDIFFTAHHTGLAFQCVGI